MQDTPTALADLITQAEDDPQPQAKSQPEPRQELMPDPATAHARPPAAASAGSRCFFRCFRSTPKEKQASLSTIVPSTTAQAPQKWKEPGRQADAQRKDLPPTRSKSADADESRKGLSIKLQDQPGARAPSPKTTLDSDSSSSSRGTASERSRRSAAHSNEPPQLGPQVGTNIGRKTLVLDSDETLVHSSFRKMTNTDIIIGVEIEGEHHQIYVRKRPDVEEFLLRVAELYEVVIYTASLSKYANPLLDKLDPGETCHWRLFRQACTRRPSGYAKDLSRLGRDLKHCIIIDNSPICYSLQPHNAIPINTWKEDPEDRELLDLIPILVSLAEVDDIPQVLRKIVWSGDEEAPSS